jgi:hypothetical protein
MNETIEHIITSDSEGNSLYGDRNYKLHLPADLPACRFWSVIVYDSETRQIIISDQPWPSVYSSCSKLVINHNGSVDVWFGPKAPPYKENNWIQTIQGKEWYSILRLYDLLESWLDKRWRPRELVEVIY